MELQAMVSRKKQQEVNLMMMIVMTISSQPARLTPSQASSKISTIKEKRLKELTKLKLKWSSIDFMNPRMIMKIDIDTFET